MEEIEGTHMEHIRIRLGGIMDAIIHKDTVIRYRGLATLLGLPENHPSMRKLLDDLSDEQRELILDAPW